MSTIRDLLNQPKQPVASSLIRGTTAMRAAEGTMNETDYRNLRNRWCRGIDWCVAKVGRKWRILGMDYPQDFRTKHEAYERVTSIVLNESRSRA